MQQRYILINAIMSVFQIVAISIVLFFLYRFLLKTIGVEKLGIWSLVLATTSFTQIANLGLSGSVVKFVAKYLARGEDENISKIIQTAAISIAGSIGLVLLAGYPLIKWVLGIVISSESLSFALEILPFSLFALWVLMIANIFNASLDGAQRIYVRNVILITGSIFYFLLAFILTPLHGLRGLAYAQIIQNITILICSWICLKRYLSFLPIIPYQWNRKAFNEITTYGINFQIISITQMVYDPMTKAFLSKFGGLPIVGYYEMANRLVLQVRSLIVASAQVLVPTIADLRERIPDRIQAVYLTSYRILFYLSLPLFTLLLISLPLISEVWIGHYEKIFIVFGILLTSAWLLNMLNAPAYIAYLGMGELRWNVAGHITIAFLNTALGLLLGTFYDGIGVVTGWSISLVLGSSIIYLSYHVKYRIPLVELIPRSSRTILIICWGSVFLALILEYNFNHVTNRIVLNTLILSVFVIIVAIPLWLHPMRKRIVGWVNQLLLSRSTN